MGSAEEQPASNRLNATLKVDSDEVVFINLVFYFQEAFMAKKT